MTSVTSLSITSSLPKILRFNPSKCLHHHPHRSNHIISRSFRRHHRRRGRHFNPISTKPTSSPSNENLQMIIDVQNLPTSLSIKKLVSSSELKFNQFIDSGTEAFKDLKSLITIDSDRRVIVSCRRSMVEYFGNLVIWGLVIVFAFRVLIKIVLGIRSRFFGFGYGGGMVRRRDRSLGGREVVVGVKEKEKRNNEFSVLKNPLSPARGSLRGVSEAVPKNWGRRKEKLPSWWPVSLPSPVVTVNKEVYQTMANRLIRAIMDNRVCGRDISHDDIIQLHRICRASGVSVYIDTANARDSLYRASVDFVLNVCGSVPSLCTSVQIDGEDARQFIAGLADNIGLESIRAARMVSAAVAARTRSFFLQAWALEMQGKHSEALAELSKICLIHCIFPPEQCSPEMEMVARGLEKQLKPEQREFLLNMLIGVCGQQTRGSVAEALDKFT